MEATLPAVTSRASFFSPRPALLDTGALLAALSVGLLAPSTWLIYAFVVAGQAHFFMSYLYQYRGGKMSARYITVALLILGGSLVYLVLLGEQGLWPFLLVALLFPIHFALDEVLLHGEKLDTRRLTTALTFALLSFLIVLTEAFPVAGYGLITVAALFFASAGARIALRTASIARSEWYLLATGAVVVALALFGRPEQALSIIILLHGLNWCIGYGARLKGKGEKEREYWFLTFVTLGASILAFAAFLTLKIEPLRYFFLVFYYDLWAIAHVTLSFRGLTSR